MPTKVNRGYCCEKYCRNMKRKDRHRCFTCDTRRKRIKNPTRAAYRALKDHAKERLIPFTLTFYYFRKFALRTDYLNRKGPTAHCLTVDRIDNLRGYVAGNIQPLTREQNSIKQAKRDAIRMKAGFAWTTKYEDQNQHQGVSEGAEFSGRSSSRKNHVADSKQRSH